MWGMLLVVWKGFWPTSGHSVTLVSQCSFRYKQQLLYMKHVALSMLCVYHLVIFVSFFAQKVSLACRLLVRLESLLGIYSDLVRYYVAVCVGVHRSSAKLLSVLASIFTQLAQKVVTLLQLFSTAQVQLDHNCCLS